MERVYEMLAHGYKPRVIAAEMGCAYQTLRNRINKNVRGRGLKTPEQAVALHIAEKIKSRVPAALHEHIDQIMQVEL